MLLALTTSCATTHGASTVEPARFDYNEAINRSESQQLLLNLVRLRYRDPPTFLALSSVVTQYEYVGRVGASGAVTLGDPTSGSPGATLGLDYRERPTLSYAPLSGEAFAQKLLSPIAPQSLLLLSQAGWSLERLVICCVDRLNGIINATTATGPTPRTIPDNGAVRRLAAALRQLQNQGVLRFTMQSTAESRRAAIHLDRARVSELELEAQVQSVETQLGITPGLENYAITSQGVTNDPATLDLRGRSVLGVMFAFSHAVAVPAEHRNAGLVTESTAEEGGPQSWDEVLGSMFRIRSSADAPEGAFVSVRYRDHWFFIDDRDLETKTTFLLVNYLLALQSAAATGNAPMLTLPF